MSANLKVGLAAAAGLACFMGVGIYVGVSGFSAHQELDKVGVETRGAAVAKGFRKIGGDLVPMEVHRTRLYGRAAERANYLASVSSFVVRYTYEVDGETYGQIQDMPKSVVDEHDWREYREVPVIVKYHPKKPDVGRIVGFVEDEEEELDKGAQGGSGEVRDGGRGSEGG